MDGWVGWLGSWRPPAPTHARLLRPPLPPPARAPLPQWFTAAGFTDIQLKRIGPSWYRGVRRHGLIMGEQGGRAAPRLVVP